MFNFNKFYWSQLTVKQLRTILFDTKQLDTERKGAREELILRTSKNTINLVVLNDVINAVNVLYTIQ